MKTALDVITQWVNASNAHDAQAVASLYREDALLLQVASGDLLRGRGAIETAFAGFYGAFPTWLKEPSSILPSNDEWATVEWKASGLFLADFEGHKATGRPFVIRGCGIFHVVEQKIVLHRRYFDRRAWYQQIGIP